METFDLDRFLHAQEYNYTRALQEIKKGRKSTHWMWFIFPQIKGLGFSDISRRYAIQSKQEAAAYLSHDILGPRLIEISSALLALGTNDPYTIFGNPDQMKLQSCMTLFTTVESAPPVFQQVLDKYFNGEQDERTIKILTDV